MYFLNQFATNQQNSQIERERSDLTVQLMGLSERLEEAEGSSESQVCHFFSSF